MSKKTKLEAAQTRLDILEAAIEVFTRKGVSSTTLQDIAAESGNTRGAVYHHFKNKGEMLKELLLSVALPADVLEDYFEKTKNDDPLDALQVWSNQALERLLNDDRANRIHRILYHRCELVEEMNPVLEAEKTKVCRMMEIIVRQFARARQLGILRDDIDPEQAAYAYHCLCMGLYTNSLRQPWAETICVPYKVATDAFLTGLRARK